jgi:flavin-dependent dehydrogenase
VRSYGFDPAEIWGLRGFHLPLRQPGSPLADGNVLLVGDAAGLLDPLTGEGISAGIQSGRIAAEQIAAFLSGEAPDLEGYRRGLEQELLPELRVSRQIHDVYHLWPSLFVGIERRTSMLWGALARLFRGDLTYLAVKGKLGHAWPVVELLADLVRVAPPLRRMSGLRDPAPPERYFRRGAQRHPRQL